MNDPEIRDIKVEWVSLPGAMDGSKHLHIAQMHGNGSVTELWLTARQAQLAAATAERTPPPPSDFEYRLYGTDVDNIIPPRQPPAAAKELK